MVKSAIIFSDKGRNQNKQIKTPDRVSLSRDEYSNVIREAYQEGRNDALKENKQRHRHEPRSESKKRDKATFANWQKENSQQKGEQEAIQREAKEKAENVQRFKSITARQDIEMLRAHSIFPFTLFTDTLVIDTTKVTLVKKQLYATEYLTTIPLKDLSDVNVQTVLFLGTLLIRYMPQSNTPGMNEPVNVRIENLKRKDAIKAKNILKGALVAKAEEIDIAKLSPEEVVEVLEKFGESEGVI